MIKVEISPLNLLVNIQRSRRCKKFITEVVYEYEMKVDENIRQQCGEFLKLAKNLSKLEENPNRPLFSEETTRKVIGELVDNRKN